MSSDYQDSTSFIEEEMAFFAGARRRAAASTQEQRLAWRSETVMQRRTRISKEVYDLFGGEIRYGPFAGIRLGDDLWWGAPDLGAIMLGVYEKEILELLTSDAFSYCDTLISLGTADGYYPIGMLKTNRLARAICFEISEKGQAALRSNAALNGVEDRIEVHGEADADFLSALDIDDFSRIIVLVDVEGAEFDILTSDVLRKLMYAQIVIEIHNWIDGFENKYAQFLKDAGEFFQLRRVEPVERHINSFEELDEFTDDNRLLLCSEGRPNKMRFLHLTPRQAD